MRLHTALTLFALSCIPAAWAGGTATIASGGDSMQMEYDGNRVRMNMPGQPDAYLLIRDDKLYSVANGMVFDAGGMMQSFGSAPDGGDNIAQFHSLKGTGRTETHAGISGEVHIMDFTDADGRRQQQELVLSSDRRARELQQAFQTMTETMAHASGVDIDGAQQMSAALGNRGVLRAGSDMRVTAITDGNPPASRFELPSKPQDTGGFGKALGNMFGGKAERQQGRVESRTDSEVDQATDSAVDGVLDKAFDKLFGG